MTWSASVRQAQALGLGHAVLGGQRLIGNEPFALLADDLDGRCGGQQAGLAQMVEQFNEWRASILAVQEVPQEHTRRYGIVAGTSVNEQLMDVTRIVEEARPRSGPLAARRRGPLHPDARRVGEIASQPRGVGGEIQLTDGIAGLLRRERRCSPTAMTASATTAAAAGGLPAGQWNWPWRTRSSARAFATTCVVLRSDQTFVQQKATRCVAFLLMLLLLLLLYSAALQHVDEFTILAALL